MAGTNGIDPIVQLTERQKCPLAPTKMKYQSSEAAWEAARFRTSESGVEIIAYACPGCGLFHLSRKVKGSDVVVAAPVGITTGALRKKSQTFHALPERVELPPEGPIVPANPDARRKMLVEYLEGKDGVTTDEILQLLSCSRHSVAKYMSEQGWRSERGPGAKWRPKSRLVVLPDPQPLSELEASIARHPASVARHDDSWVVTKFPVDVSVQAYLQALTLAGLTVEVRVRRTQ